MVIFSKSQVAQFRHTNKALRWGQAFHKFMKLDKCRNESDKYFCDKLYNASDDEAKALVASRTDNAQ